MDTDELRKKALQSIEQVQLNPFTKKLGLTPVVQVHSRREVSGFPVKFKYMGYKDGQHVYNLDARQILQYLDRRELEFNLSPSQSDTQPLKNPLLRRVRRGLTVFVCYTR